MDLTQDFQGGLWVNAYHKGNEDDPNPSITVSGKRYDGAIALASTGKLIQLADLTAEHLIDYLNACEADIMTGLGIQENQQLECCLIGGAQGSLLWRWPEIALFKQLQLKGCAVDVMSLDAACRTYNVLASEGRWVAAFLII